MLIRRATISTTFNNNILRWAYKSRFARVACCALAIVLLALTYWFLLVPRVDMRTVIARTAVETYRPDAKGELGNIEQGQTVRFEVTVNPGIIPIDDVHAELPTAVLKEFAGPRQLTFMRLAGGNIFTSSAYKLLPLGTQIEPSEAGEVRNIRLVLRNRLGISTVVRLAVRVVPESLRSRTA